MWKIHIKCREVICSYSASRFLPQMQFKILFSVIFSYVSIKKLKFHFYSFFFGFRAHLNTNLKFSYYIFFWWNHVKFCDLNFDFRVKRFPCMCCCCDVNVEIKRKRKNVKNWAAEKKKVLSLKMSFWCLQNTLINKHKYDFVSIKTNHSVFLCIKIK